METVTSCDLPIPLVTQIKEDPETVLPSSLQTDGEQMAPQAPQIPSRFKKLKSYSSEKLQRRRKEMYTSFSQILTLSRDRESQDYNLELDDGNVNLTLDVLRLYRNMQGLVCNVSNIHGWGLFATRDFKANDPLIEYTGEIIRLAVVDRREEMYEKSGNRGSYIFRLGDDDSEYIDATIIGGPARFINHSCDPNCATKIMTFDGVKHIVIYAIEDIKKGTELCYDYKLTYESKEKRIKCLCGSKNCRQWLNWSEKAENRIKRNQEYMERNTPEEVRPKGTQEEELQKFGKQLLQDEECEEDEGETTDTESDDADYR